ncbi:DUF2996 domain-containing protein [Aerosakkonema funiforme]|uniref:DUF2996 domain-containing protein n=1 Tax=Aerosakkonema funiforme FACHB-1375 TaxID=2949571 RepID=A0A926VG11_9CYAN|nr:DUF2996 domain-containing protein [Aerosakkonema funiforme]MBD2183235.1 DUF2996 domain-containing protein [Aerosakkonema funiforme FACHB-1375]
MAEETNHNEAGENAPSTVDKQAPSVAEENAPSTDSPATTDIPTANAPDPTAVNPEANPNAAEEKPAKAKAAAKKPPKAEAEAGGDTEEKPAKKPAGKKEKAPGVEDKPFADFVQQDYLPAITAALAKQGVNDLQLSFEKQKIPIIGFAKEPECWQIIGSWNKGLRQFRVYFFNEDIQGQRAFSFAENGGKPSTLEPFLIDERKITLDLLVFGVVQRLNAQKWLVRN